MSPADPRIHHTLGVAAYLDGDLEAARESLQRAVQLSPDSDATWTALRDVCSDRGDRACAAAAEAERERLMRDARTEGRG